MTRVFHLSTISTKKEEKNQKKKEITTANSNLNLSFNCVDKREQFRSTAPGGTKTTLSPRFSSPKQFCWAHRPSTKASLLP